MNYESFTCYQNLTHLLPKTDLFVVDLWGVIHDGQQLYPDVIHTLHRLQEQNKPIIFLSNAPRRSHKVIAQLKQFGIDRSLFLDVVSSGECAAQWYQQGRLHPLTNQAKTPSESLSFYYVGPVKDRDVFDGLHCHLATEPNQADLVLLTGFDHDHSTLAEKRAELDACLAASLPALCLNPDRVIVRRNGQSALCAGILADYYQQQGGEVHYFGKPHLCVYQYCCDLAEQYGIGTRITAIGDSLETDIAGAIAMKWHHVLITGGIISIQFPDTPWGQLPDLSALYQYCCQSAHLVPESVMPRFFLP
jgi:HAD superfamily hydrolase (TIGR01459 family)